MNEHTPFKVEDVSEPTKPPKARVSDAPPEAPRVEPVAETFERKKDYLAGFLAQKPAEASPAEPGGSRPQVRPPDEPEGGLDLYEAVVDALKDIYDPEIPVNIYDLGLIYRVEVTPENHAIVTMTLTTPHCPVAESMPGEVELRVGSVPGIGDAEVNLVWDPPWDPSKMTDEARLELGML
jgi:FeS assembly SUF system protein